MSKHKYEAREIEISPYEDSDDGWRTIKFEFWVDNWKIGEDHFLTVFRHATARDCHKRVREALAGLKANYELYELKEIEL